METVSRVGRQKYLSLRRRRQSRFRTSRHSAMPLLRPFQLPRHQFGVADLFRSAKKMEFYADVQRRWLVALLCGVISIVVMLLVRLTGGPGYGGGHALLMALFSAVGLLTGVLSIAAKEKRRNLAYFAITLSVLPWVVGVIVAVFKSFAS
jgi:hypothetical protein